MTMSLVTAADSGATLPLAGISCPDAGEEIKAEHIRTPVADFLAMAKWLMDSQRTVYEYSEIGTIGGSWVLTAPATAIGNTWTNTSITIDIPSCLVGDDLEITAWGSWQLNASTSAGDVAGRARIQITEDATGSPLVVPNLDGVATIYDDGGSLTLPHNENYSLTYKRRVATAGTARITVQGRSEDIVGGAATGTIIFMFSARLDVVRYRRT